MNKRFASSDILALTLVAGIFVLTAALYQRLPEQVPTHFGVDGVPNGWMSRPYGAFALPVIALGLWGLLRVGPLFLPVEWRARMLASPLGLVAIVFIAFMGAVQCVVLRAALSPAPSAGTVPMLLVGGLWVALGLVLPRIRRNPWIGVRTTWTLSSDENWAATHRFAGMTFLGGGLLAMLATSIGGSASGIAIPFILISAVMPAVYSFFLARRLPPQS